MRTDLDHLPAAKQRELERVVRLFEEIRRSTHPCDAGVKEKGRILKIILYGSYARGGWVDEPHTAGLPVRLRSPVVNDERLTDRVQYWAKAEERLNRELAITRTLGTPVNFIVHSLHEVNDGLAHGRFFFI
jgi:predicted nucleotidyltransferase